MNHPLRQSIARCVFFLCCLTLSFGQQPGGGSIQGRVADSSGQPIRKATVTATLSVSTAAGRQQVRYRAVTGVDGGYSISGIEAGQVFGVSAERTGYVTEATERRVSIASGQALTGFNFSLAAAASVSGTVTDQDGDPVTGAAVSVLRLGEDNDGKRMFTPALVSPGTQPRPTLTDISGRYSVQNLPAGTYYVKAGSSDSIGPVREVFDVNGLRAMRRNASPAEVKVGPREEAYLTTWYPRNGDESAAPVSLLPGAAARADIQLRKSPVFAVRGTVSGAASGSAEQIRVAVNSDTAGMLFMPLNPNEGRVNGNGSFEFHGVPPGNYYLTSGTTGPGQSELRSRQKITVADKDLEGVAIEFGPMAEVRGNIEGTSAATVSLAGPDGSQFYTTSVKPGGGSFTMPRVVPGSYRLRVSMPEGSFVKSASVRDTAVGDSAFTLDAGVSAMRIITGTASAQIRINVQPGLDGSTTEHVLIVPITKIVGVTWKFREYSRADDGRFVISAVVPGTYRVYATEPPVDTRDFDPETLKQFESKSVKVTVDSEPTLTTLRAFSMTR